MVDTGAFPNIAAALEEVGLDPRRDLLPVAPRRSTTRWAESPATSTAAHRCRPLRGGDSACAGLHARTGWPPTRWRIASCSAAAPRLPPARTPSRRWPPSPTSNPHPSARDETRAALWRHAGLQRDPETAPPHDDPFPLARLIGASCLAREESRGAHQRSDHSTLSPAFDGMHTLGTAAARQRFERWI